MLKIKVVSFFASISLAMLSGCQTTGGSPQGEGSKAAKLDSAAPPAQKKFAKSVDEYYDVRRQILKEHDAIGANPIKQEALDKRWDANKQKFWEDLFALVGPGGG